MPHVKLEEEDQQQPQQDTFWIRHKHDGQLALLVLVLITFVVCVLVLIAYTAKQEPTANPPSPQSSVPDTFQVILQTTVDVSDGKIILQITKAYAPYGVQHFFDLLTLTNGSYYNNNGFYKVIPGQLVQFGINGIPAISAMYNTPIPSDPLKISNTMGTVTFATTTENDRRTQILINLQDNAALDNEGNPPIGTVISGMDVAAAVYSDYDDEPQESLIFSQGNAYLRQSFVNLDYVIQTTVVDN